MRQNYAAVAAASSVFARAARQLFLLFAFIFLAASAQAATWYSVNGGDPTVLASWKPNADGTGTSPGNFAGTNDVYILQATHTMTQAAGTTWTLTNGGKYEIWGTLIIASTANATPITANTGSVENGGTIRYQRSGGNIPLATWRTGSTMELSPYVASTNTVPTLGSFPGNIAQAYHHLIIDVSLTTAATMNITSIAGDLTFRNTGGLNVNLTSSAASAINIGRDLIFDRASSITSGGGTIAVVGSTGTSNSFVLNVGRNFTMTGAASYSHLNLASGSSIAHQLTVAGDMTISTVTGNNSISFGNSALPSGHSGVYTVNGNFSFNGNNLSLNGASSTTPILIMRVNGNFSANGTITAGNSSNNNTSIELYKTTAGDQNVAINALTNINLRFENNGTNLTGNITVPTNRTLTVAKGDIKLNTFKITTGILSLSNSSATTVAVSATTGNTSTNTIEVTGTTNAIMYGTNVVLDVSSREQLLYLSGGSGISTNGTQSATRHIKGSIAMLINGSGTFNFPLYTTESVPLAVTINSLNPASSWVALAQAFDGATGGTAGAGVANNNGLSTISNHRYWMLKNISGSYSNSTNISLTDAQTASFPLVGYSPTLAGTYLSLGGSAASGTTTSTRTFVPGSTNYFVLGTSTATLSGTYGVGASRTYPTLTDLAADLASKTLTGNVRAEIYSDYVPSSETYPIAFTGVNNGGTYTVTIYPHSSHSGTVTHTMPSGQTSEIFHLTNMSLFTLDGRKGATGTTRSWKIEHQNAALNNSMRLVNGNSNVTLNYLEFRSAIVGTSVLQGQLAFGGSTTANTNCTVSNCLFADYTSASLKVYANGIIASGNNTGHTVSNCLFENFGNNSSSAVGTGIAVSSTASGWTITGNRFYHSNVLTTVMICRAILLNANVSGCTISDNYIGSASASFTGVTQQTSSVNFRYTGIDLQGPDNLVVRNTIDKFDIQSNATAVDLFAGINTSVGGNTIGGSAANKNVIGSSTSGSIKVNASNTSTSTMMVGIIATTSGNKNTEVSYNEIGGLLYNNTSSATNNSAPIQAVRVAFGTSPASNIISNNKIGIVGNTAAPITHNTGLATGTTNYDVAGVYMGNAGAAGGTAVITNNTISNLAVLTNGAMAVGVKVLPGGSNGVNITISNNLISNLTSTSTLSASPSITAPNVCGIHAVTSLDNQVNIAGNTITDLSTTATAANASLVTGIFTAFAYSTVGGTSTQVVYGNYITRLLNLAGAAVNPGTSLSNFAAINGITSNGAGTYQSTYNNVIRLDNGSNTGPVLLYGYNQLFGQVSFNQNTIWLGGSTTSSVIMSAAYRNSNTNADRVYNNIFINDRTNAGGTQLNSAMMLASASTTRHIDYNIYKGSSGNLISHYSSGSLTPTANATYGSLKAYIYTTTSPSAANITNLGVSDLHSGDASGLATTAILVNPANAVNPTIADMKLQTSSPNPAESTGGTLAAVADDIDGESRSTTPDIGADEASAQASTAATDIFAPDVTLATVGNSFSTTGRTLAAVATVTDRGGSGVNTTTFVPRLYYRAQKLNSGYTGASDNNYLSSNNASSSSSGWKYVDGTAAGSDQYSFVLDYSVLYTNNEGIVQGSAVIEYFVVAQDQASTPNWAGNLAKGLPAGGSNVTDIITTSGASPARATAFSGQAAASGGQPASNRYLIVAGTPFTTDFTIGSGGTYATLSAAIQALNANGINGKVTGYIISDITETDNVVANRTLTVSMENLTDSLIFRPGNPGGDHTVVATTRTVTSAINTDNTAIVVLNGVRNVVFNGHDLSDNDRLAFAISSGTPSGARPAIATITNTCNNIVIRNMQLSSNSTNGSTLGAVVHMPIGCNNCVIANNVFSYTGATPTNTYINASGGTTNNLVISGNKFGGFSNFGISLTSNAIASGWEVSNNEFSLRSSASTAITVINLVRGSDHKVQNNRIYAETNTSIGNAVTAISVGTGTAGTNNLITGNLIGGTDITGGGNPFATTITTGGNITGITLRAANGTASTVSNNVLRNIQSSSLTASHVMINITGGTVNVTGNQIGGLPGFIGMSSSGSTTTMLGIAVNSTGNTTISGNTVAYFANPSTALASQGVTAIYAAGTGNVAISKNTIRSIQISSTPGGINLAAGIWAINSGSLTIDSCSIDNVNSVGSSTGALPRQSVGILVGATGSSTYPSSASITRNTIHSISVNNTNDQAIGINLLGAQGALVANNMIRLSPVANCLVAGIANGLAPTVSEEPAALGQGNQFYNNTVVIDGGTSAGTRPTYAFLRNTSNANTIDAKNNIFYNNRAGTLTFAIGNQGSGASTAFRSNYNALFSSGSIARRSGVALTFAQHKAATSADSTSLVFAPSFTSLSSSSPDLHLTSTANCQLKRRGTVLASVTNDIDGNVRPTSPTRPTIGADQTSALTATGTSLFLGVKNNQFTESENWCDDASPNNGANVRVLGTGIFPAEFTEARYFTDLTVDEDASLTLTYNIMGVSGQLTNNGSLAVTTGTLLFNGTTQSMITGPNATYNIGNLTVGSSTQLTLLRRHTVTGTLEVQGTLLLDSSVTVSGSLTNTGTVTTGTDKAVIMNGTGTLASSGTLGNLTLEDPANVALSSTSRVAGVLSLMGGSLTLNGRTLQVYGTDALIIRLNGIINTTGGGSLALGLNAVSTGDDYTLPDNLFSTPTLTNLTINRDSSVTLGNQNITVTGTLTINKGSLITGSRKITMGQPGSHGTVATTGTGVLVGTLEHNISTSVRSYFFPVGVVRSRRPATVQFTQAPVIGGLLTGSYVAEVPGNSGLPLIDNGKQINTTGITGYWNIHNLGITDFEYNITLADQNVAGVNDISGLRLLKREDSNSPWVAVGGHSAPTGTTSSFSIARTGLTSFSQFVYGSNASENPLPVVLLAFKGHREGSAAQLQWLTQSEKNVSHFRVERSIDGQTFSEVGQVAATNQMGSRYAFTDERSTGYNFYRLAMIDRDGSLEYSPVIRLANSASFEVRLSPNPARGSSRVVISSKDASQYAVSIMSLSGQVLHTLAPQTVSGLGAIALPTEQLPAGIYLVEVVSATEKQVLRLVKE